MSDEQQVTTEVDNAGMQDSFFQDSDLQDVLSQGQNNENANAETVSNESQHTQTQEGGNEQTAGFEGNFFNEKGEFDLNGARSFISSGMSQPSSEPNVFHQMNTPQHAPPVPPKPEDNLEPWEKDYNDISEKRKAHYERYNKVFSYMEKAASEGHQGQAIWDRARQLASEDADNDWRKEEHKRIWEQKEKDRKALEEERSFSELIPKSRNNLGILYREIKGGEKGFNDFMFGPEIIKDGKATGQRDVSKAYGSDAIAWAFNITNEGKDIPKDQQALLDYYEKWWTRFTSNQKNLQTVYDMALARLQLHFNQYQAAALKARGVKENQQRQSASNRAPSPNSTKQQFQKEKPASESPFDRLLNQPDFITDSV